MSNQREISLYKFDDGTLAQVTDTVAVEEPLAIFINGSELATLLYTPQMSLELALGYLLSEGLISSRDDIASLSMKKGAVFIQLTKSIPESSHAGKVITSGCGGGIIFSYPQGVSEIRKVKAGAVAKIDAVLGLASEFRKKSELFEQTGGVHSAALSDGESFVAFADDIGRHNAVDKVLGSCLLAGVSPFGKLLFTTGRVSSEILLKCARQGIPVIISRGAPTSLAVSLGRKLGLTVAGFVRGRRMNIYTHPGRLV
ncbi:MAG TPA: formate dehydrogenase accessory sulfurtransferase FdhD [Nitrospirota bacterium]